MHNRQPHGTSVPVVCVMAAVRGIPSLEVCRFLSYRSANPRTAATSDCVAAIEGSSNFTN